MIDTPDALIEAILFPVDLADADPDALEALRARLTAGDAAIKRVAELEAKKQALLDGMKLQDGELIEAGMVLEDHEWCNARAEKAEADLAAARAEIEEVAGCFNAAFAEGWIDALANGDPERLRDIWQRRLMYAYETALAPKENADAKD